MKLSDLAKRLDQHYWQDSTTAQEAAAALREAEELLRESVALLEMDAIANEVGHDTWFILKRIRHLLSESGGEGD